MKHKVPAVSLIIGWFLVYLASSLAAGSTFAASLRTADKVYSTEINARNFDMLIPKGISEIRGIIFYGPGVGGNSRSALIDAAYIAKSHLFGYPVLTYNKGGMVVPRDANAAISNIASQCGMPMDADTPIYAQGFSNGGGNTWAWPCSSPGRTLSYFVNKGDSARGNLPNAALGIPGINIYGDQEPPSKTNNQQSLFINNRTRGALLALVAEQGAIHGEFDEYVHLGDPYLWIIHAVRNPLGKPPLSAVNETNGWLADPDTRKTSMMKVYAYADYPAGKNKRAANWLYNKDIAFTYSAFCTFNKQIALTASPSQLLYRDSDYRDFDLPATINQADNSVMFTATVDSSVGTISKLEFFEFSRRLGDMPIIGPHTFTVNNITRGIHNYLVLATSATGTVYISNSWTVYTE